MAAVLAVVGTLAIVAGVLLQWSAPAERDLGAIPVPPLAAPLVPTVPAPTVPAGSQASPPARIVVPAIGVTSGVSRVGLNPDRTMEVPPKGPLFDLAAWYRFSVTPGEQGPSVIIGHIDSRENGPSVFFRLGELAPGDAVEVTREDGRRVGFTVHATRTFPKDAFPTGDVYGGTTGPELRLITCGGSFDRDDRSYRDNTVVFLRETATPGGTRQP